VRKNPLSSRLSLRHALERAGDYTRLAETRIKVKPLGTVVALGRVRAIEYVSSRDGRAYRHNFSSKGSRRPLLASSLDGDALIMLGGAYRVTGRGIENK
jgi:hypothetical protein